MLVIGVLYGNNVHNVKVECDLLHQRNILIFLMQEVVLHFH